MSVVAAVVADGHRGLDGAACVSGVPMVALAVRALLATGLVEHVEVLTDPSRHAEFERACAGLPVRMGVGFHAAGTHVRQRAESTVGDGSVTAGAADDIVLLHEAIRPLAPAGLAIAVVAAVRAGHEMAVPTLPVADTVKTVDADGFVRGSPDRAGLRVVQTPIAFRAGLLPAVSAVPDPLDIVHRFTAAGGVAHTVPGDPAAFAVRSAWDLELAELLARRTIKP